MFAGSFEAFPSAMYHHVAPCQVMYAMCIICGTSYGMFWSLCPALVVRPSLGELLSAFCLSIRVFDSTNACTTGSAVGALWFDTLGR